MNTTDPNEGFFSAAERAVLGTIKHAQAVYDLEIATSALIRIAHMRARYEMAALNDRQGSMANLQQQVVANLTQDREAAIMLSE